MPYSTFTGVYIYFKLRSYKNDLSLLAVAIQSYVMLTIYLSLLFL